MRVGSLELALATASAATRASAQQQLDEALQAFADFRTHLRITYPRYAALKYAEPVSVKGVQSVLGADSAVVEFFVGSDFVAEWLITKNGMDVHVLWNPESLLQEAKSYRDSLTHPGSVPDAEQGHQLYAALLGPVESHLAGVRHLILVPDGELSKLPFEALVTRVTAGVPEYAVERYAISYAQSGSVLVTLAERRTPVGQRPLFAMGRPTYSLPPEPASTASNAEMEAMARGGDSVDATLYSYYLGKRTLKDLPATEEEVDQIGAILKSKEYVFKGAEATESRVKDYSARGLLNQFRYVHFATHGLVSDDVPALTSVVLARDPATNDDGFLTVGEVYGLDLNSDLVTLSACGLGLGKTEKGEGVVGLTRAFLYAGTSAVAVSLWSVADEATAKLMSNAGREHQSSCSAL